MTPCLLAEAVTNRTK